MSNLKQMLDICKTIPKAKKFAEDLIDNKNIKDVWLDLSLLNATEGNYKESIRCLDQIKDYPPTKYHYIYCMGYYEMLLDHDLSKGFTSMNLGRNAGLWGNGFLNTDKPIVHDTSCLMGKTILINMEAGLGDQIVFLRFIKQLKDIYDCMIIVKCSECLKDVFIQTSFIDKVISDNEYLNIDFDYWIPSMFLPVLLSTSYDDLIGDKYLVADTKYVDKYKYISENKSGRNIGIRWLGQAGDDYITRVFPEQLLFDLFENTNDNVYSLQKDNSLSLPHSIIDMDKEMLSWHDTMGIIENLDLVITSCTSIAHASAAMGKETWVIIPKTPYYVWINKDGFSDKSDWYDSVTLFQQEKYGEWKDVFTKIKNKLQNILINRGIT